MVQCAGVRAAALTLARLSRPCRVFCARNQTCSRAGHHAFLSVLWQHSFSMSSKTRVLATSHAAQQGPVDEWLMAQVSNALTATALWGTIFTKCACGLAGGHHSLSNAGHAGPSRSSVAEAADACCREPRLFSLSVRVSSCILPVCGSIATIQVE